MYMNRADIKKSEVVRSKAVKVICTYKEGWLRRHCRDLNFLYRDELEQPEGRPLVTHFLRHWPFSKFSGVLRSCMEKLLPRMSLYLDHQVDENNMGKWEWQGLMPPMKCKTMSLSSQTSDRDNSRVCGYKETWNLCMESGSCRETRRQKVSHQYWASSSWPTRESQF